MRLPVAVRGSKTSVLKLFNVFKTHRDRPRSARSLFRLSQELIAATQAENAEQACPSDFLTLREEVFLHEYSRDTLRGDDGGPPTEAPDPPPTDTDRSAKELCTSTDEYRFERDSFQQEFAGINTAYEDKKIYTERQLDKALRGGHEHFDSIKENVTPRILTSCKTNALFKAFEVKKNLNDLPDRGGAERNEFQMLANSVDEFTAALINPLKSDDDSRSTFRSCLDSVMEKAIDTEQKKVL
ncbi:hypothetical protein OS493_025252 [Desmophyllum pertusum]|uniref:Uncharacterized protein n=1 Tax=Desmophyllum pertusum TaxID=174260 RepID=A0A9X0CXF8_9CNID|nr:hypothetical protein OS493_025252 [Desmophyllum pertusum]